ncbi:M20/M25/M40 family metallo-hydrolase [Sphingomonas donggukensis]|uniref:M20/M25/M40 family metallo-hydrolase n=1 Tax=Sphingomonas donggukensis TaxID=2949093 RepID=A0ABY4TSY4_9SPHN|nr:M20/M25/M40 family metallo-hydrolase [Sphingomonas donggukensis]URW75518.1 M20/M25/M40 family metallo-hydrolase [Sphingomonas donggukensis]
MIRPAIALAAALLPVAAHAQTAPQLARMRATVAAEQERSVALLERLVNQNSGSLNIAGVTKVADMMRAELTQLGFGVAWEDMKATGRAGHLVATKPGKGKRVLLIAHLDTVFEQSSPFQRFVRKGDGATGPGIGDDKGGLVVIVAALRAMQAAGTLRDAAVTVYLTGDEEKTGTPLSTARGGLIAAGKAADYALEYEGLVADAGRDMGTIARRSAASWELKTTGVTGHSAGIFNAASGYGAVYEMARILDTFRRELPEPNLTYNVGVMAGGTPATVDASGTDVTASGKTNIIAAQGVARGDLRTLTPEQDAAVRAKMQAIVAQHLPKTGATLTFFDSYPPMAPTPRNTALLDKLNAVNKALGLAEMPALDPSRRGAADSGFVAADVATLGGLGTLGAGSHAEGESVDLTSIPRQALRSAALITRLTQERR